ncbi:unnamed protein product [Protopolystoma xenopodis]|uniref:Uncharacterized protein n=1 Tax=Protopolystoma xenopodis TaxID=117903 RepID=A0A3S5CLV3_9PLAT|nr:unnamed protein product [Protopolystoma xenopodis]
MDFLSKKYELEVLPISDGGVKDSSQWACLELRCCKGKEKHFVRSLSYVPGSKTSELRQTYLSCATKHNFLSFLDGEAEKPRIL